MKSKKRKGGRAPSFPQWVPSRFKDLVENIPYKKYRSGLTEIMAAELRALVVSLGEGMVHAIRMDDILPENALNTILNRLIKCWPDPVAHEKEIFSIQKEMAGNYKITPQKFAKGGE
jgi:hypothetical protein